MTIKLGVDNGNYNTKSSEGMLYASGYAASDKEFITDEMQLCYDGRYYAIGEKRMRFQQDKTKTPDTFLLTLPAIASAMKKAGVSDAEILLGVGLPIEAYPCTPIPVQGLERRSQGNPWRRSHPGRGTSKARLASRDL